MTGARLLFHRGLGGRRASSTSLLSLRQASVCLFCPAPTSWHVLSGRRQLVASGVIEDLAVHPLVIVSYAGFVCQAFFFFCRILFFCWNIRSNAETHTHNAFWELTSTPFPVCNLVSLCPPRRSPKPPLLFLLVSVFLLQRAAFQVHFWVISIRCHLAENAFYRFLVPSHLSGMR